MATLDELVIRARAGSLALPEISDLRQAAAIADDAIYVGVHELHGVDEHRILRYDLTLPLLMTVRYHGQPLRIWTVGKAYRLGTLDAMHLEAFHQSEVFCMDRRGRLDPWSVRGSSGSRCSATASTRKIEAARVA